MEVVKFACDAGTVVRVEGRIDGSTAPAFDTFLVEQVEADGRPVVLCFAQVPFISSAGLRCLLSLAKRVDRAGGGITMVNLQPLVREVFEISGFISLFRVLPNLADALVAHGMPADLCGPHSEAPSSAEDAANEGGASRWFRRLRPSR